LTFIHAGEKRENANQVHKKFLPPTTGQRAEGEVIELSGAKLEGLNRGFLNLFVLSIQ